MVEGHGFDLTVADTLRLSSDRVSEAMSMSSIRDVHAAALHEAEELEAVEVLVWLDVLLLECPLLSGICKDESGMTWISGRERILL